MAEETKTSKYPKADANRKMREERYEAEQARMKSLSAKPKRSTVTHEKIKADIEAAAKGKRK